MEMKMGTKFDWEDAFRAELVDALKYDPETGIFTWDNPPYNHRRIVGQQAGSDVSGYVMIRIGNKRYGAHRLAWLYEYGVWPPEVVDHADGNPKNNAIKNLRACSVKENVANARLKAGKCTPKGVRRWNNRYEARITGPNGSESLGMYDTPEAASERYMQRATELHGKFARAK